MQEIILKKGKEFPLKRFHPWVFSGALKTQTKGIEEGEKVRIVDAKRLEYRLGPVTQHSLSLE